MTAQNGVRLRFEFVNGSPVNDYRICDGRVEVRLLDASGRPYPGTTSDWRVLNRNEIQLHHDLRTVVSEWLRVRLGTEVLPLDKAA